MIAIIIAGGSGSRLWPLSTPSYPKHLLAVGNDEETLLQQTYRRISTVADTVYVMTEQSHDAHVIEQLPDLPNERCIVEPGRRGTANCTLLALKELAEHHDPHESFVILWADHYIRDTEGFAHSMRLAAQAAQREKRIVLVGVEPTVPATGFGYIKKKKLLNNEDFVYEVASFKEKPNLELAESFIRSGKYLWNSGYFISTFETFVHEMGHYAPEMETHFQGLQSSDDANSYYLKLPASDINYSLIERIPDLLVVPATFDWMDLGSYIDLHKASLSDNLGNFTKGNVAIHSVENSYIQNQEDKPLAVIGLDNIAVINTKDGILITRKDLSQAVGEISKQIHEEKT